MKANMKQFLILTVLVLAGCGEQTAEDIMKEVNDHGTLTVRQAEIIVQNQEQSAHDQPLYLNGLTSINDAQAESLGKSPWLLLNGLTSMTDTQAKSFTKVVELKTETLNELTSDYMKSSSTPEIKLYCDEKIKFSLLDKIVKDIPKHYDSSAKLITIDGVRLETENFWFLLRASNTQNCIVFRLEHFVKDKFKEELIKLISILESYSLDIRELISFNQTV